MRGTKKALCSYSDSLHAVSHLSPQVPRLGDEWRGPKRAMTLAILRISFALECATLIQLGQEFSALRYSDILRSFREAVENGKGAGVACRPVRMISSKLYVRAAFSFFCPRTSTPTETEMLHCCLVASHGARNASAYRGLARSPLVRKRHLDLRRQQTSLRTGMFRVLS